MKMFKKVATLGLLSLGLTSCIGTGYHNMSGGLLISKGSDTIYASGKIGSKKGEACAHNYLGLFSMGDTSVATAAKNGSISNVSTIDTSFQSYVVYGKTCTIVRGE